MKSQMNNEMLLAASEDQRLKDILVPKEGSLPNSPKHECLQSAGSAPESKLEGNCASSSPTLETS